MLKQTVGDHCWSARCGVPRRRPAGAAGTDRRPRPAAQARAAGRKGPRPEQFKFPPLDFTPPKAADFRTTLSNGLVVYVAEDHEIPWFEATLLSPVIVGPAAGAAVAAGRGGRGDRSRRTAGGARRGRGPLVPRAPRQAGRRDPHGVHHAVRRHDVDDRRPDQRADGLPGRHRDRRRRSPSTSRHLDEGLKIWLDILTNPAFPEDRLRREKQAMLPGIRNRNRNINDGRRRGRSSGSIYGDDVADLGRADRGHHQRHHARRPGGLAQEVLGREQRDPGRGRRLQEGRDAAEARGHVRQVAERRRRPRRRARRPSRRRSPASTWCSRRAPRRTRASSGSATSAMTQDDPDYPAVDLMNYTLGGGSFSSRITKIVRTDNGLAYTANSSVAGGAALPGHVPAFCQTKNATVVFATQLMLNEIERMHAGDITETDLTFAKTARLNAFPSMFSDVSGNAHATSPGSNSTSGPATTTTPTSSATEGDAGRRQAGGAEVPAAGQADHPGGRQHRRVQGRGRASCCRTRRPSTRWRRSSAGARSTACARKYGDGTVHVRHAEVAGNEQGGRSMRTGRPGVTQRRSGWRPRPPRPCLPTRAAARRRSTPTALTTKVASRNSARSACGRRGSCPP